MILFKSSTQLRKYLEIQRKRGSSIGFVPTMGALHEGHISLIRESRKTNEITVCSIFVNPVQFNVRSDFEKYPSMIDKDILLLEKASCDILFHPTEKEIYPDNSKPSPHFELGSLENILEGAFRPGHFQGVCRVVDILLDIVDPDNLYIGQKDYQQCMVIKKLVDLKGKSGDTRVVIGATLREPDGLAMSSRNLRLTLEDRKRATGISRQLTEIKNNLKPGNLVQIKMDAVEKLTALGFRVDYVEIADANTLQVVDNWDGNQKLVALIAAFLGDVRLIDNMTIS